MDITEFRDLIAEKGHELYRAMPWRDDTRPYYILVSELMLQQTQVDRVVPKFQAFISAFPDEHSLANAPLSDVLTLWNGLGYNRRAKYLHDSAKKILSEYNGVFPDSEELLLTLPGVGKNTCGAILAYAFNHPALYIETNVRTVYFYHFFTDGDKVDDKQIIQLLAGTIDTQNPREFFWALMDYGSYLKKAGVGKIQQSRHYKKQSLLKGSVREVRGQILRSLTNNDNTIAGIRDTIDYDERFEPALFGLIKDGLVTRTADDTLHLTST